MSDTWNDADALRSSRGKTTRRGRVVAVRPLPLAAPTDSSCEIVSCTVGRGGRRMAEERGGSGTDEGVPGPMFDAIKSGSRVNRLLSLSLLLSRIVRKSFVLYIRAYEKPFIENRFWYRC